MREMCILSVFRQGFFILVFGTLLDSKVRRLGEQNRWGKKSNAMIVVYCFNDIVGAFCPLQESLYNKL